MFQLEQEDKKAKKKNVDIYVALHRVKKGKKQTNKETAALFSSLVGLGIAFGDRRVLVVVGVDKEE